MLDIAEVDFSIAVPPLGQRVLTQRTTFLFDEWDEYIAANIPLDDYALYFELEEGSLKGKGRLRSHIWTFVQVLAALDGATNAIPKLARYGRDAAAYVVEEAEKTLIPPNSPTSMKSRRSAGDVGRLERLFQRVGNRELDPHAAAEEAMRILGREPGVTPELLAEVRHALMHAPRKPKQLILDFGDGSFNSGDDDSQESKRKRRSPSAPPLPAPSLYRVEVYRESKKGKRHVKREAI